MTRKSLLIHSTPGTDQTTLTKHLVNYLRQRQQREEEKDEAEREEEEEREEYTVDVVKVPLRSGFSRDSLITMLHDRSESAITSHTWGGYLFLSPYLPLSLPPLPPSLPSLPPSPPLPPSLPPSLSPSPPSSLLPSIPPSLLPSFPTSLPPALTNSLLPSLPPPPPYTDLLVPYSRHTAPPTSTNPGRGRSTVLVMEGMEKVKDVEEVLSELFTAMECREVGQPVWIDGVRGTTAHDPLHPAGHYYLSSNCYIIATHCG